MTDARLKVVTHDLPEPPYPAATQARGWRFEFDLDRIEQSRTWIKATPEIRPWLLMLWLKSWNSIPMGSYDADDELIAARIGMPYAMFQAHREALMRGWYLATDGRLYHEYIEVVVAKLMGVRMMDRQRKAEKRAKEKGDCPADSGGHHRNPKESGAVLGCRREVNPSSQEERSNPFN